MAKPGGEGVVLLPLTIALLSFAWVTVIARLAVRRWKKMLGLDDWLMCIGLVLYTVTCSLVIVCCFHGAGQLSKNIEPADQMKGIKLFFIAEFFYSSCTVPIKASICVTLLRIADARRRFVWTIYGVIGLSVVATIIFIAGVANICHPITAVWGETTGKCNFEVNSSVSFVFSAVSIVTDWTLAILPAILLWNIQMKPRVKFSVMIVLGLAAFASCATIVRLKFLTLYNNPAEFMFSTGSIGIWSVVEEGIGITAGSLPSLRPLLNLPIFGRSTYASGGSNNDYPSGHMDSRLSARHRKYQEDGIKLDSYAASSTPGFQDTRPRRSVDDDADSGKHILKQTQVTVVAERENSGAADDWTRNQVLGWKKG